MRRSGLLICVLSSLLCVAASPVDKGSNQEEPEGIVKSARLLPAPAADEAFQYARWTPGCLYPDGKTKVKLEVWLTGKVKSVQLFSGNVDYAFLSDDGKNGDRKAGDNIWTLGKYTKQWGNFWFPGFYTTGHRVRVTMKDGTVQEPALPSLGVAEQRKKPYEAVKVMKNFYATRYAAFLIDKKGTLLEGQIPICEVTCGKGNQEVFKMFYKGFDDQFDFLAVMPAVTIFYPTDLSERVPYCVPAKNEIQNIGVPIFDNTHLFGSAGRLQAVIYHSFGSGAIFDHEWGHNWGVRIGDALDFSGRTNKYYGGDTGWHYTGYSNIVGQMASKPQLEMKDNGDGTWKVAKVFDKEKDRPFAPLTLYQMGLIPPSEVPPVKILTDVNYNNFNRIPDSKFDTYTIDEIMAANGGQRIPSYPNAQKKYRMAFIIVSDRKFTQAEYDYFSAMAKYFGSKEEGSHYMTPFHALTGGRAKLKTKLPKVK